MVYVEYNQIRTKYLLAQMQYDFILSEQEELFIRTQPQAVNIENERVTGGDPLSPFDTYLIQKERKHIDERLKEIKSILADREQLLKLKEQELRASKDWNDIIFVHYFLDKLSIRQIECRIPYSRRQIYRFINTIKSNLKTGG